MSETRHFAEDLDLLKDRLLLMGGLAQKRVADGVNALVAGDTAKLQELIDSDDVLNTLQLEIDDTCFKLLALQQPVATDLRRGSLYRPSRSAPIWSGSATWRSTSPKRRIRT